MTPALFLKAGICPNCRHAQAVESGKGSVFILCQKSKEDPSFRKYPPLPVLNCKGYDALDANN